MKTWHAIGLGLGVAAWTTVVSAATPLHGKVSVDFRNVGLARALRDLGAKANVEFAFDSALVEHLDSVTLKENDVAAGRVAMRILRPRGLTLEKAAGARVRVVRREAADLFGSDREDRFAFAREPSLARDGDRVTISFETEGLCDVTVAIEREDGRILRHLASGLLGLNAPEPFLWNSRAQTLVWDGKDDAGRYVDDVGRVQVRVSLGLKARFERTLFWHPGKPASQARYSAYGGQRLLLAAAPEGIYVFDSGQGIDHIRLFDRDGAYVRTVYPFPADKIATIPDLIRHRFPDGAEIPIKPNWLQTTLLMSGSNCEPATYNDGRYHRHQSKMIANAGMRGAAGDALAVSGGRMALTGARLARLSTDGASGGLNLHGPDVSLHSGESLWTPVRGHRDEGELFLIRPKRTALSPDGTWLYLTMYNETFPGVHGTVLWRNMVKRMRFDHDEPPVVFAGGAEAGAGPGEFDMPADVACDAQGRVYVADHRNDRIQIFSESGEHLRNLPVERPARIAIRQETGELFVFSMGLPRPGRLPGSAGALPMTVPHGNYNRATRLYQLRRFSSLDDGARELDSWDLHRPTGLCGHGLSNMEISIAVDTWSDPARVWMVARSPAGSTWRRSRGMGVMLLTLEDDGWVVKRDFLEEARDAIDSIRSATFNRQRLYVNPADGLLYLGEADVAHGKGFQSLLRIEPETGRIRRVELPLTAEDMAFGRDGHAYLRTSDMVVRYEANSWREVPFDYGEERMNEGFGRSVRKTRVISGAVFPGNRGWHHGGMHVCPRGNIVVAALYSTDLKSRTDGAQVHDASSGYRPTMYPGRLYDPGGRFGGTLVHVIGRNGRLLHDDALPGLDGHDGLHGAALDARGDLYVLHASPAVINGERHFNDSSGTLMKFTPGQGRLLSDSRAPVPLIEKPARSPDLYARNAWVQGAHWMQPGIGWANNYTTACACWNTRFSMDDFARSFAPEPDRYSVAVLDSAGNLILRVGRYGNVDDGVPLVQAGASRDYGQMTPPNPRSIGGDETALKHAPYVSVHTDRRLFAADPGNARIVSVKLGYHAETTVALGDVPAAKATR